MSDSFNFAQSFFIDSAAVDGAAAVLLTSVELYFQSKPVQGKTSSNIAKPGLSVYVCPMENEQPAVNKVITGSRSRKEYDEVSTSINGTVATKCTFKKPILVSTGASYAVLIKFDGNDTGYNLWWGVSGEPHADTTKQATINSGYSDGNLYTITNGSVLTKNGSADLKFKVNIAKFTSLSETFSFTELNYELFKYYANAVTGTVKTGEYAYKNTANAAGTINVNSNSYIISGVGTSFNSSFAAGDYIVFSDGTTGNTNIRIVNSVTNSTSLILDELPHFTNTGVAYYKTAVGQVYLSDPRTDTLILQGSNANNTLYFANNDYVKFEDSGAQLRIESMLDFSVSRVTSQFNAAIPALSSVDTSLNLANSTYYTSGSTSIKLPISRRQFIDTYPATIASKSLQARTASKSLFNASTGNTTVNGAITFTTTNKYTSPYIDEEDLDIILYRYIINNDATDEEKGQGNAFSKYVSRKVVLGKDQDAEDFRMYTTAHLPQETSIKAYARMLNSDDYEIMDDKNWTPLEEVNLFDYISADDNRNDTTEKEYKIPYYHSDGTTLSGFGTMTWTASAGNTVITTSADISAQFGANGSSNSLIRVYQQASPNNFFVSYVAQSNSTTITLSDNITNGSFNTTGLKIEKISDTNKFSAFINPQNKNIVRYYTKNYAPKDTYKVFATKIVLLSENSFRGPILKDIRAIAVSA